MRKNKILIWLLFLVVFSLAVFAKGYDITYVFDTPANIKDVSAEAYVCLDADCANLDPLTVIDSNKKDNKVTVRFPNKMASQHGYALFFTSPGWLPIEVKMEVWGNGKATIKASDDPSFEFKKAAVCSAEITNLIIEVANTNETVDIDASAGMSAETSNIFSTINNNIKAVPSSLVDFYSALTDLDIEVKDSNDAVVYSNSRSDKIYFDEVWDESWAWTPTLNGTYTAVVTSTVTDTKCSATLESSASQEFEIFDSQPSNSGMCYAIINDLNILDDNVFSGKSFTFEFDWNSFLINNGGNTNIQLEFEWFILNSSGDIVDNRSVATFPISQKPKNYTITAPTLATGKEYEAYTLKIVAYPSNLDCSDIHSTTQFVDFIVWTDEEQYYDVTFRILEQAGSTNTPVFNATVELESTFDNYEESKQTGWDGKTTFEDLKEGEYDYTISKTHTDKVNRVPLKTKTGKVYVDKTQTMTFTLVEDSNYVGNNAPDIYLENIYKFVEGDDLIIDLKNFATDDNDAPEDLEWFAEDVKDHQGTYVHVVIDNENIATITADLGGETEINENVKFTVKDTEGAQTHKTVRFNVVSADDAVAPVWDTALIAKEISLKFIEGDARRPKAMFLPRYVSDDTTDSADLKFNFTLAFENDHLPKTTLESLAGISIDADNFLSILPDPDFFGVVNITLNATDAKDNSDTTLVVLNITNVDDLPKVLTTLGPINIGENDNQFNVSFSDVFYDADEYIDPTVDSLTFSIPKQPDHVNIVIDQVNRNLTLTPVGTFFGTENFSLVAEDLETKDAKNKILTAKDRVVLEDIDVVVQSQNDAPVISPVIPNMNTDEDKAFSHALGGHADDEEDDPEDLVWNASDYNASLINISIDNTDPDKWMSIIPLADQNGVTNITLTVTDSADNSASQNITFTVNAVSDAPIIQPIPNQTVQINQLFTYQVNASDADDDVLIYVAEISPAAAWFNIDQNTGLMNFTPSNLDDYNVTVKVDDGTSMVNETFTLSVVDTTDPSFNNYAPVNDTNYTFGTSLFSFSVDIVDNSNLDNVSFEYGLSQTSTTCDDNVINSIGGNTWEYDISSALAAGTYYYRWTATDDSNNTNSSEWRVFNVVKKDPEMHLFLDGVEGNITGLSQGDNVTIIGNLTEPANGTLRLYVEGESSAIKEELDASIITENYTFNKEGTFKVIFELIDTTGNYQDGNVTYSVSINDTTDPTFNNSVAPADDDYDPDREYSWTIEVNDNVEVNDSTVKLTVNSVDYDATALGNNVYGVNSTTYPGLKGLDIGVYTYSWYAEDTSGNNAATTPADLTISKANPIMNLTLNGQDTNISVSDIDNLVDIFGEMIAPVDGNLKLYVDAVEIADAPASENISIDDHPFALGGPYNVTFGFEDLTGNYNDYNVTHTVTVVHDSEAPQFGSSDSPTFEIYDPDKNYSWSMVITDNTHVDDSTVKLVLNDSITVTEHAFTSKNSTTSTYTVNLTGLDAGDYTYYWTASDTTGNNANSTQGNLKVDKADPGLTLSIDGVAGNTSAIQNENVSFAVDMLPNLAGEQIGLRYTFGAGSQVSIGNVPYQENNSFADLGDHTISAEYAGNDNYLETNVTYVLTIVEPLAKNNFAPATGTHLNNSFVNVTFETNRAVSCRWSFDDVSYGAMTVDTVANGLDHTAVVTGMTLGANNVHIACEGDNAASNEDLSYEVDNILDGSTIDPTANSVSTITTSIVTDSTVDNDSTIEDSTIRTSTIDNSTVKICQLTTCVVRNSYAENVVSSNCNIIDSPNSVINVTGDGWTVSGDSTVTNSELNDVVVQGNSNVDDSNLSDSTITNATMTNSNITNTTIEDMTLTDAVVDNGQLTDGTAVINGTTYPNANDPLPVNLYDKQNVAPVAVITKPTTTAFNTGQNIEFDASGSYDLNSNDVLTYLWDFGDGTSSTQKTVTHSYSAKGDKTVTLTVTDDAATPKSDTEVITLDISEAPGTTGGNNNNNRRSGGGGGGGGSRMQTITVDINGVEMTFRPYDSLRFKINSKMYPALINLYRLDTGKVMLMINGVRFELTEGQTINIDLDRNDYPDLSVTGVSLTNSAATLRFFPAGVTQTQQYVAPPMPVFNIPPKEDAAPAEDVKAPEPKSLPEEDETAKEEVEVNAQVGGVWDKIVGSFKKLFGATEGSADSGSQWFAMAIIAGVIVIGLGVFFVVRKIYFY